MTGLVVPVRVDPSGDTGPTRGEARGLRWRSTSAGRFVPAGVSDQLVEQRILEAYTGPDRTLSSPVGRRCGCWVVASSTGWPEMA